MEIHLNVLDLLEGETFSANDLRDALNKPHKDAVKAERTDLFNKIKQAVKNGHRSVHGVRVDTERVFWEAFEEMGNVYGFRIERRGWNHASQEAGWIITW